MDLRQLLEKQKLEAEAHRGEGEEIRTTWLEALDKLMGLIMGALLPFVRDKLLSMVSLNSLREEPFLGKYPVQELRLTPAGGAYSIWVKPVARRTLGSSGGRVDMFAEHRPDRVYMFTLASESDPSSWLIVPPKEVGIGFDHLKAKPFSQAAFEEALQKLIWSSSGFPLGG